MKFGKIQQKHSVRMIYMDCVIKDAVYIIIHKLSDT